MSGNPFRQRIQLPTDEPLSTLVTPIPAPAKTERKVKRVRIRTPPPISPDSIPETMPVYGLLNQTYEHTYFPSDPLIDRVSEPFPLTSIEPALYRKEATSPLTLDQHGETELSQLSGGFSTSDKGVVNPFSRTSKTIEKTHGPQAKPASMPHSAMKNRSNPIGTKTSKQTMDVDAFKRLLLTGNVTPASAISSSEESSGVVAPEVYVASVTDSADTLSQSRRSLDELPMDSSATSLRTFHEANAPGEDRSIGTGIADIDTEKKIPPPPPKHRYGKLVGQRIPEVVSFTDFTPTDAMSSVSRRPSKDLPPTPLEKISSNRSTPLSQNHSQSPPPPSIPQSQKHSHKSITEEQDSPEKNSTLFEKGFARTLLPLDQVPPSSTGLFQPRPHGPPRPRADSNLSIDSQREIPFPTIPDTANSSRPRPPPPPTRLPGRKLQTPTFPPNVANTASSPDLVPHREENILMPDSRRESNAMTPSSRSSSISVSNRTLAPPPPPPRRRRGSSKSSVELNVPVTSSTSFIEPVSYNLVRNKVDHSDLAEVAEGDDGVSVPTRASGGSQDVLSNLDALQAEVDALRLRYG